MGQIGRRCLFASEFVLSLAVIGLAVYLLVKGPLVDTDYYYSVTDLRYAAPRFLVAVGGWSCFFSIVWFFSNFSLSSSDAEIKRYSVLILLITLIELMYWAIAAGVTGYVTWLYQDINSFPWEFAAAAAGCAAIMAWLEFTNFVLACCDIHHVRKAKRGHLATSKV